VLSFEVRMHRRQERHMSILIAVRLQNILRHLPNPWSGLLAQARSSRWFCNGAGDRNMQV
jgi:hypothetical protein